jgi:hypothetical protein
MAEVINDTTDDDNRQEEVAPAPEAPPPVPEPEVPEKFRGKSASDIAKMYAELEHRLGAQGSELGELRKLSDTFIRSTLAKRDEPKAESPTDSTDDDSQFFINPREAIKKAVEQHPLVQELRSKQTESQRERAARTFREKHPDAQDVVQEPEFRTWVQGSKVRQELLMRADRDFDVDAGDELLSTWKQIKAAKAPPKVEAPPPPEKEATEAARKEAVRAGTVPSGNAAPDTGGKKIYRRADLIRLRERDPDRYEAMADEILAAYQEKRVR